MGAVCCSERRRSQEPSIPVAQAKPRDNPVHNEETKPQFASESSHTSEDGVHIYSQFDEHAPQHEEQSSTQPSSEEDDETTDSETGVREPVTEPQDFVVGTMTNDATTEEEEFVVEVAASGTIMRAKSRGDLSNDQ